MGRAESRPRERRSRNLTSGLRRPAGPVSFPSSRSARLSGEPAESARVPVPAAPREPARPSSGLAARLSRGWCAALLALALLPAAGTAQAQTERVLVSNIGQDFDPVGFQTDIWRRANAFTTGSSRHGYTLTGVDVKFIDQPDSTVAVKLASGSSSPGTVVATLTNPSTLSAGDLTFTAPSGTTLSAGANYWVIVEGGGSDGSVGRTPRDGEDAASQPGWVVGDTLTSQNIASPAGWNSNSIGSALLIRINGYEIPDTFGPELQSAAVGASDRKKIHLVFDEPLASGSVPASAAFTVKVDDTAKDLASSNAVAVSGRRVTLTLGTTVPETTGTPATPPTVTVSYDKSQAGSGKSLSDALGNEADSFSDQTVRSANRAPTISGSVQTTLNLNTLTLASLDGSTVSFSDPDGDTLTFSTTEDPPGALIAFAENTAINRSFFEHTSLCGLMNLDPQPTGTTHVTTHTLTATDPYGASVSMTRTLTAGLVVGGVTPTVFACPTLSGDPAVDGRTLTLTYKGSTSLSVSVSASEFAVTVDGQAVEVSSVSIADPTSSGTIETTVVTLTLAEAVWAGQTVKLSHSPTGVVKTTATPSTYTDYSTTGFTDRAVTVTSTNHRPTITVADADLSQDAAPATRTTVGMTVADPDITSGLTVVEAGGTPTDASTVNVRVTSDRPEAVEAMGYDASAMQAHFTIKSNDDLCELDPAPDTNPFTTAFTVTATDSDGASVSREIVATTTWKPDECQPAFESAVVDVATLTLTFSKALDEASVPSASAFSVSVAGTAQTPTAVAVSGSTVTLTLGTVVAHGQEVTVDYVKPTGAGATPLLGADPPRLPVDALSGETVTNNTPPPPEYRGAAVYGTVLQITFSHTPLDTTPAARPAPGAFTVMVEGVRRNVSSVSVAAETVGLRLASAVRPGERVTVAYDRPASGAALRNPAGFEAPSFNSADSGTPDVTHATPVTPAVLGAEVREDVVTVTFDRALDPDRRPSASRFRVEQYFRVYAAVPVSRVEIPPSTPDTLVLILARSVRTGAAQPIRMHYAQGGGTVLQGAFGRPVGSLGPLALDNRTTVPKFGSPGTESYAQVGPNVNDSPCGRYRPGVTLDEWAADYRYVCDTSQRQWTLAAFAVPGVDYSADSEIDWTLVADWYAGRGRCVLRGYDELAQEWRQMSTPSKELCDGARMKAAQEGGVVSLSISLAEPVAAPTANAVISLAEPVAAPTGNAFRIMSASPTANAFKSPSPAASALKSASPAANALKSVAFRTEGGTATPGLDYRPTHGRLVFGPGEHTKTVQVQTLRDGESEEPETVNLRLFDAQGFTLSPEGKELVATIMDGPTTDVPVVTGVAITSDPGADATYGPGDTVRVRVAFDQAVSVDTAGGTPRLTIDMDPADWGAKPATYESGSGTAALVFAFGPVASPNVSTRGVAVLADTLETGGGTIRSVSKGVDALLGHAGLDHDPAHRVDWSQDPNQAPTVEEGSQHYASFTASGNAPRGTLVSKQIHGIFSDPDGDDLTYTVTLGDDGQAGLVDLLHVTTEADLAAIPAHRREILLRVWFRADAEADWDAMDPAVPDPVAIPVTLTATDPGGLSASVEGVFQTHWGPPRVESVAVVSDAGSESTYALGDVIRVAVTFGDPVTVDTSGGVPRLAIDMDPAEWGTKHAALESGSGTTELVFAYEVVEPNISTQGIAVPANSLEANGGTMRLATALSSAHWMTADLRHAGLPHDPDHKVDWRIVPPAVTSVAVVSRPASGDTYMLGETIRVAVTFDAAVTVTGTPALSIDMDPADWGEKRAAYESGSGTTELVFAHEVVEPNYSTEGIAVLENSLAPGGGTIRSAAGAHAELAHGGLGHDAGHKVDWRPVISVADAVANEGTDAAAEFEVSLSRAFTNTEHSVTVDYATADGTATAGEDYTATSGTLTFGPGESLKTVSVPVLDDALDEGEETFTLRLSNARGAQIADGEATGTIKNSDPLQKMWLSRFGRTVADHVTGAVSDRLSGPVTGVQVTVGGQNLDLEAMEDEAWLDRTMVSMARVLGVPEGQSPGDDGWPDTDLYLHESPASGSAPVRPMTGREILLGSSFHLAGDSGDGGGADSGMTAWGRVTTGGFDGEAPADGGNVRIDGEVTTGIFGTDAKWGRVLAGIALSVSEGEGTFDQPGVDSGEIESTMTTGSPYARVDLNDRVSAWGMAGLGTGEMTIVQQANEATNQPERITRTDLSLRMAAVGGRGALLEAGETGGMNLALKGDAFFVRTESDAISGEGATKADASRVRLILEGSRAFRLDNGALLTPGLELGLRHDGGDAETGTGVELGGRIAYANPETGLNLESNVRALVAHEDAGYEEWGASVALGMVPGDRGRGLSFSLAPTYGTPGSGVERLWSARDAGGLASGGDTFEPESRIEGEIGYGLPAFGDRFTGTPNFGFALADGGARDYRFGWRLAPAHGGSFEVSLDATRSEPAGAGGSGSAPEHAVVLRAGVRW